MSKGSAQRPCQIDKKDFDTRWDKIFNTKEEFYGKSFLELIDKQQYEDIKNKHAIKVLPKVTD